jgi:hypothetical protein
MTLHNLKARFLLDKDDSEAALFMQERVKDAVAHMVRDTSLTMTSHSSHPFWQTTTTRIYDEFQRMQNGIDF